MAKETPSASTRGKWSDDEKVSLCNEIEARTRSQDVVAQDYREYNLSTPLNVLPTEQSCFRRDLPVPHFVSIRIHSYCFYKDNAI